MRNRLSQKEVHDKAIMAFRKRIDIGLMNGAANLVLEAPNPFQPEAQRRPKRGLALFLLLGAFFIGSFVYFNL